MTRKNIFILPFVLILFNPFNTFAQIEKGLVARYLFNGTANDISGNNNHGTIQNGVTDTEDRFGNKCAAYHFDGTSGYIVVPDSRSLNSISNKLSATVWVKLEEGTPWSDLRWLSIFCKSDRPVEATDNPAYRFQATSVTLSLNTDFTENLKQNLDFETWYFYAITYDGNIVRAYINGVETWNFAWQTSFNSNNYELNIGRDVPGNLEYYAGVMDDLRIYRRDLSASEVMTIYKDDSERNSPKPCPNTPTTTPPTTSTLPIPPTQPVTPAPTDTDGDGYPDNVDKCPKLASSTNGGCPPPDPIALPTDTDGDGYPDNVDKCPKLASSTNGGCPPPDPIALPTDTDGDGYPDNVDKCPKLASSTNGGCPPPDPIALPTDTDGDGYPDNVDKCPKLASSTNGGCPPPAPIALPTDTDGDGYPDNVDKCPKLASSTNGGCPPPDPIALPTDTDGDGYPDNVDKCPKLASSTNGGCPESSVPLTSDGLDTVLIKQTVVVKSEDITIFMYDNEKEDGDTVSVQWNGKWVIEKYGLRLKHIDSKKIELKLVKNRPNYLISKAHNLGAIQPNTLTIEIRAAKTKPQIIRLDSQIGVSAAICIVFDPS